MTCPDCLLICRISKILPRLFPVIMTKLKTYRKCPKRFRLHWNIVCAEHTSSLLSKLNLGQSTLFIFYSGNRTFSSLIDFSGSDLNIFNDHINTHTITCLCKRGMPAGWSPHDLGQARLWSLTLV